MWYYCHDVAECCCTREIYRDEYILVTEEYEVGDTIEAKRKAEEQERIENKQILEINAFRLGIVNKY